MGWAILAGLLSISNARADVPVDVLVVPVVRDDAQFEPLRELARTVADELERRGLPHLSMQEAGEVLVRRHSRSPSVVSPDALERFRAEAQQALDAVTNAEWPLALERLRRAMEIADSSLESTNRNERAAQQLFQACLLTLQVLADRGDLAEARQQAVGCVVRSPGMELPERRNEYAPIVRELLLEGRRALAAEEAGPIEITSSPEGCAVRVNGRSVGSTPFTLEHPGHHSYQVQVECSGDVGRVHEVVPNDQITRLAVDLGFEGALRTDHSGLSLHLTNAPGASGRDYVRSLLRILSAKNALVLSQSEHGRFLLQRTGDDGTRAVVLDDGFAPEDLGQSLDALLAPAPPGGEDSKRGDAALALPVQDTSRAGLGIWQKALATGALTAGGAALGLGYAFHRSQVRAGDVFQGTAAGSTVFPERGRAWDEKRALPYVWTSIGASAVTAGAIAPLISTKRSLPWWATSIVGAVGSGLLAWGIADLAAGGRCGTGGAPIEASCVDEQDRRDRGGIVLLTSVPLLSVAGLHAVRAFTTSSAATSEAFLSPRIGRQHVGLGVTRRF